MVIGRSEARENPWGPMRVSNAVTLSGTRVAEPIWASGPRRPPRTGRTYDRKRTARPLRRPLRAGGRPHMDPAVEPRGDRGATGTARERLNLGRCMRLNVTGTGYQLPS